MTPDVDQADVHVGLDLGTSGLKAVALDAAGRIVARARSDYPTNRPEPGGAEQDPADWQRAVQHVVRDLLTQVPAARWAAVGLSAMIPTLVLTDAQGAATGAAITWEDARAEPEATALRAALGADDLYRATGQWLDGRYLLPMAIRLQRRGELPRTAAWLLGAKDFVFAWLTGSFSTDPSTASGVGAYDVHTARWRDDVVGAAMTLAGGKLPRLPQVVDSTTRGPIRHPLAEALGLRRGLEVTIGAADSVCGALGLGLHDTGDVAYLAGSSSVILGISQDIVLDPRHRFLVTPLATPGFGLEMDLLATGSAFAWCRDLLGLRDVTQVSDLLHSLDPDTPGLPTFAPYLAPGEQGALWEPTLTGALSGLSLAHGRAEVVRALASGIVVESARCLEVLAQTMPLRGIHVSGRSAPDPIPQDLADASGHEVVVHSDSGWRCAVGAALITRASDLTAPVGEVTLRTPDPSREAVWRRLRREQDRLPGGSTRVPLS
jgi:xylulokinase